MKQTKQIFQIHELNTRSFTMAAGVTAFFYGLIVSLIALCFKPRFSQTDSVELILMPLIYTGLATLSTLISCTVLNFALTLSPGIFAFSIENAPANAPEPESAAEEAGEACAGCGLALEKGSKICPGCGAVR